VIQKELKRWDPGDSQFYPRRHIGVWNPSVGSCLRPSTAKGKTKSKETSLVWVPYY
jgi:hypothetical protein